MLHIATGIIVNVIIIKFIFDKINIEFLSVFTFNAYFFLFLLTRYKPESIIHSLTRDPI